MALEARLRARTAINLPINISLDAQVQRQAGVREVNRSFDRRRRGSFPAKLRICPEFNWQHHKYLSAAQLTRRSKIEEREAWKHLSAVGKGNTS